MSNSTQVYRQDETYLRAMSAYARIGAQLDSIESHLRDAHSWIPSRELLAELAWVKGKIREMEESWARKLLVALVGPSGAGKSTLLNALAGRELSPTGMDRPTTREVIIYAQSLADAEGLVHYCGSDKVSATIDHEAGGLEYLTLVDAPDTNTLPENQALLAKVLEMTDVVVAVFSAQNPKLHDNIAFLRPYIEAFPEDAVVVVLNQVDRITRHELEEEVVPDFRRTIASEWGMTPANMFLTSARSSTPAPVYPEDEEPLHGTNETAELRGFLDEYVQTAGQLVDRRLLRAEQLLGLIRLHLSEALAQTKEARGEAQARLSSFSGRTTKVLLDQFQRLGDDQIRSAPSVALYGSLTPRWWGPIGWILSLWNILLQLGSGVGRLLRRSTAMSLPFPGSGSSRREATGGQNAPGESSSELGFLSFVLSDLYVREWPPVADSFVKAGFDAVVRDTARWSNWAADYQEGIVARWREVFNRRISALAKYLSLWPLQILLNAPTLALVGWVCYETLRSYFAGNYLSVDYYRQTVIVIVLVWLASFVVLQLLVALVTGQSFYRRLSRDLASSERAPATQWEVELTALARLQALGAESTSPVAYPQFWARHFRQA